MPRAGRPPADGTTSPTRVSDDSRKSVVTATRAQLARMIDLKEFEVGVRLPPADALAAQLGVSRPVVLEALKLLEQDGRVSVRRGLAGVRVLDARGPNRERRADRVRQNAKKIAEMTVVREVVDPALARLAARRRSRRQLVKDLTAIHRSMLEHQEPLEPWLALDIKFHWRIAEAADNESLAEISLTARQSIAPALDLISGRRPPSHTEHQELIDALTAADPDRAAAAAYQHVHATTLRIRAVLKSLQTDDTPADV